MSTEESKALEATVRRADLAVNTAAWLNAQAGWLNIQAWCYAQYLVDADTAQIEEIFEEKQNDILEWLFTGDLETSPEETFEKRFKRNLKARLHQSVERIVNNMFIDASLEPGEMAKILGSVDIEITAYRASETKREMHSYINELCPADDATWFIESEDEGVEPF